MLPPEEVYEFDPYKLFRRIDMQSDASRSAIRLGMTAFVFLLGWLGASWLFPALDAALHGSMPPAATGFLAFAVMLAAAASFHYLFYTVIPLKFGRSSANADERLRTLLKDNMPHSTQSNDHIKWMLFENVFEFSEKTAREIMIPRTEMTCLYLNLPFEANKRIILDHMHTRYPVCETDKDNIIGLIHVKDFLATSGTKDLRPLLRDIVKVPESVPISQLMKTLQRGRTHMALVIDEYGGSAGIVTFEDIIEELVGEVHDEFDEERAPIESLDHDTYSIDGLLLIADVNRYFETDIDTDWYDTIGGWMYANIPSPPAVGERVICGNYEFIVEETDHLRVSRILVRKSQTEHENERAFGTG